MSVNFKHQNECASAKQRSLYKRDHITGCKNSAKATTVSGANITWTDRVVRRCPRNQLLAQVCNHSRRHCCCEVVPFKWVSCPIVPLVTVRGVHSECRNVRRSVRRVSNESGKRVNTLNTNMHDPPPPFPRAITYSSMRDTAPLMSRFIKNL
jgi:hypothetical protein